MERTKTPTNTRVGLLAAAVRLILHEGAARVTLEAVAKEAGVSKGGLLYHFPTKDALVAGLVEHYAATFAAQVRALAETDKSPQALLRAYVRATFAEESASKDLGAAVLGAVLLNPALFTAYRERLQWVGERLEEGAPDPARAAVVRLAADGLWFGELLSVAAFSPEARTALERAMLELLEG